jgi:hypothetical protein
MKTDMDKDIDMDMYGDLDMDMDADTQTFKGCRISDIGKKFHPISDILSDSAVFSPISEVLISGSVRYSSSRISE